MKTTLKLVMVALMTALGFGSDKGQAEVEATTERLTQASNDEDSRFTNSTVHIGPPQGGCTGTLITPQVVLTAGHCGFHGDPQGTCPNRWVQLPSFIDVHFGNDRRSFKRTMKATHWNISGSEDTSSCWRWMGRCRQASRRRGNP